MGTDSGTFELDSRDGSSMRDEMTVLVVERASLAPLLSPISPRVAFTVMGLIWVRKLHAEGLVHSAGAVPANCQSLKKQKTKWRQPVQ